MCTRNVCRVFCIDNPHDVSVTLADEVEKLLAVFFLFFDGRSGEFICNRAELFHGADGNCWIMLVERPCI
jgi:hypothetical protein